MHVAFVHDLSTEAACLGTYVDDIVGRTDDVFVVLHHDHGVACLLQLAKHADELVGIAAMKPYGGLVEDVERAHERTAQ